MIPIDGSAHQEGGSFRSLAETCCTGDVGRNLLRQPSLLERGEVLLNGSCNLPTDSWQQDRPEMPGWAGWLGLTAAQREAGAQLADRVPAELLGTVPSAGVAIHAGRHAAPALAGRSGASSSFPMLPSGVAGELVTSVRSAPDTDRSRPLSENMRPVPEKLRLSSEKPRPCLV